MAHVTTYAPAESPVWNTLVTLARGFGKAMTVGAVAPERIREMQSLQQLSDAELSARGISRDRIAHHVFRDIYDL